MTRKITNKPFIQKKSKSHQVTEIGDGVFEVVSGSSGETYTVVERETGATCTCPWGQYRTWSDPQSGCSHVVSVFRFKFEQENRKVSVWTSPEDAKRQKKAQVEIGDGVILTTRKS